MKTIDDLRIALRYPTLSSTPDTAGIVAKGRRRRTVRRTLAGVASLAVLAGVGSVVALQVGSGPDPAAPIAGGAPNPMLVAATEPIAIDAPRRFDPLRRTLNVGWIPSGLGSQSAETTPYRQEFGGSDAAWVNGGPDLGLSVTVLAKGRPVTEFFGGAAGLPLEPVARPTDPINGGSAECLTDPDVPGSCSTIRWHYAPDAWAQVSYAGKGKSREQAAAVARRVAESVTLTGGEVVRMPFTLKKSLAEMTVAETWVGVNTPGFHNMYGEAWSVNVHLVPAGTPIQPMFTYPGLGVDVMFIPGNPSGRVEDKDNPPNRTIDGHPAWLKDDGSDLTVWGASGTRSGARYEDGDGDALAAYANVKLLADPADPAGWPPIH